MKTNNYNCNDEKMERPSDEFVKGKRSFVWYWRACAAYDLAKIKTGENVTRVEYDKAFDLLARTIHYALADARQWENANTYERYANSTQCTEDEKRLDKRREKLNAEFKAYGLYLKNYGLYPSLDADDGRQDIIRLYYFD